MTVNIVLVVAVGALFAAGLYMILERSLTRLLLGILLLSNGINVLLLMAGGAAGQAPILGYSTPEEMSDPLSQAMILTAIVITFGMAAFVLSLIYRSWHLAQADDVIDDVEDKRLRDSAPEDTEIEGQLEDLGDEK
jgi:multicomponent Na+:H+ antiporter subunit C